MASFFLFLIDRYKTDLEVMSCMTTEYCVCEILRASNRCTNIEIRRYLTGHTSVGFMYD